MDELGAIGGLLLRPPAGSVTVAGTATTPAGHGLHLSLPWSGPCSKAGVEAEMMTVAVLAEDAADGIVEEGGELLLLLLTGMLETVPGTEIPPLPLQKEEA